MAFKTKIDYCKLATVFSDLEIRDDAENISAQTYQPVSNDGDIIATETYSVDSAPTNSYGLKGAITASAADLQLGKVNTVSTKKYTLESVSISTSAGSPVAITATAQLVESGASDATLFDVPAFALTTRHKAQDPFSVFTVANGTMTSCNTEISSTVTKDRIVTASSAATDSNIVSSDINSGLITVSATILAKTASTAPTATAASGWTITAPLTCTNPETQYPEYTITAVKALAIHTTTVNTNT